MRILHSQGNKLLSVPGADWGKTSTIFSRTIVSISVFGALQERNLAFKSVAMCLWPSSYWIETTSLWCCVKENFGRINCARSERNDLVLIYFGDLNYGRNCGNPYGNKEARHLGAKKKFA
jgi:hypothetical protein